MEALREFLKLNPLNASYTSTASLEADEGTHPQRDFDKMTNHETEPIDKAALPSYSEHDPTIRTPHINERYSNGMNKDI